MLGHGGLGGARGVVLGHLRGHVADGGHRGRGRGGHHVRLEGTLHLDGGEGGEYDKNMSVFFGTKSSFSTLIS